MTPSQLPPSALSNTVPSITTYGTRSTPDACATRCLDGAVTSGIPSGFEYVVRKSGDVVITHHGREASVLRGKAAAQFLARIATGDPQQLMARATGHYKHGNERRGSR